MRKDKDFKIKTSSTARKSAIFEKDMKEIAKGIFSYNPKTDPNDPLFGKASKKEAGKRK